MRNLAASLLGAGVRIGISRHALCAVRHGVLGRNATVILDGHHPEDMSAQNLVLHCRTALAEASCAGLPLSVTLGDELVRLFMVTPPQNAAGLQDLRAAAGMRFQALYGEPPRDWHIDAAWQAGAPFLACAIPLQLAEQCKALAKEFGMSLLALQPHFVAAWNAARSVLSASKESCWLAVLHDGYLTLGVVTRKPDTLLAIRGMALPAGLADFTWLEEQVARTALQAGTEAPASLLLAGDAHEAWTSPKSAELKLSRFTKETLPGAGRLHGVAVASNEIKAA